MKTTDLTPFQRAYIACALWSSTDDDGEPLDASRGDIHPDTLAEMVSDCENFLALEWEGKTVAEWLEQAGNDEQNGHDFWLTRNRHGAGFWARGYPDRIDAILTEAAHSFGSHDLYVGDDGMLHGN